jgi:fructose-bisphosphate aldolase class II
VYKPGNVRLHPELLGKHQAYVREKSGSKEEKPVFLVFHGGSGSSVEEFRTAISYGVVKVNLGSYLMPSSSLAVTRPLTQGRHRSPVGIPDRNP